MPPRGESDGFSERNVAFGQTWSSYTEDQRTVFKPRYFEQLALEALAFLPSSQTQAAIFSNQSDTMDDTAVPPEEKLTPEELSTYLPVFQAHVNLKKLAGDFKDGHLYRHSQNQTSRESVMKGQLKKIVDQVGSISLS